jgi:hypothetical protein
MSIPKLIVALLLTLSLVVLTSPIAWAQADEEADQEDEAVSYDDEIYFQPHTKVMPEAANILDDIRRGQHFLKDKIAGGIQIAQKKKVTVRVKKRGGKGKRYAQKTKIVTERISKPNFLLAVKDLKEEKIWPVLITNAGCATRGFEVSKKHGKGVGSRFEVRYPDDMVILALRTTVRAGKNSFEEVVYTPYSPDIDTLRVRQRGYDYLRDQIEQAYADLKGRRVRLGGFERLDGDISPVEVALVLSIIEHIDPLRFVTCEKGQELTLVREVLTVIGANTADAYAYSKSPAGARGLFQFIPDTYKRIVRKYPRAGLKKDFVEGCTDHVNAAKASLLLFDADLDSLPDHRIAAMRHNIMETGRYLAAAYNCGAARVHASATRCRNGWTCRLPEETKIYLKKFDVVWDLRDSFVQ